jgi:hypothetical protein
MVNVFPCLWEILILNDRFGAANTAKAQTRFIAIAFEIATIPRIAKILGDSRIAFHGRQIATANNPALLDR